jgi:uncharacterized protein (TIGR03085 family)
MLDEPTNSGSGLPKSMVPRRVEALATLVDEGCTHEQAYLIEGTEGPVVVYVMEVDDIEASQEAARSSEHPIDADHKRVMELDVGTSCRPSFFSIFTGEETVPLRRACDASRLPSRSVNALPLARRDRLALCDLFDELGPDARTLNEGWTTADLAAHLVARDRRPDSVPGLVVPALAAWSEHVRHGVLRRPYTDIVENLRTGPPRWSPLRRPAADRIGNTHEFFVHYEDVRRCRDGWEPRQLDAAAEADIWRVVRWFGRRAFRQSPVGVVLRSGDQMFPAHRGTPAVTVAGPPGEILLYAFGRQGYARVDLNGDSAAVEALATTTLSW